MQSYHNNLPQNIQKIYWHNLYGSSRSLPIVRLALEKPVFIITEDVLSLSILEQELQFFSKNEKNFSIRSFPDWETLPYDHFSPHQDIISQRLETLYHLPSLTHGIILAAASTLMQKLPPKEYLEKNSFILTIKDKIDIAKLRLRLENAGYRLVAKVIEHGEYAVRGSIIDLFPMGSNTPYRIDLFDQEVESIRIFDPDTQRTINKTSKINLLPAKEYPLDPNSISTFRQSWRSTFAGDPNNCPLYQNIVQGESYPGIEYYLPLFFSTTHTIFDYLSANSIIIIPENLEQTLTNLWNKIKERHEQLNHDVTHPILDPQSIYLLTDQVFARVNHFPQIQINPEKPKPTIAKIDFKTQPVPNAKIGEQLPHTLQIPNSRFLFVAESAGRRESLLELLKTFSLFPVVVNSYQDFVNSDLVYGITLGSLQKGLFLPATTTSSNIILISENELFGEQVMQRRLRKKQTQNTEAIISNLTELQIGAPVVHLDYGVGRYLGLQTFRVGSQETEFLILEYANATKLYVPVSALHLISRYSGVDPEHAPLYHLGSKQWEKAKKEAATKIHDVAAELLEVYATRQAHKGFSFAKPDKDYQDFAKAFPFEVTLDQERAINDVIEDMTSERTMDRLICGDVGFGKTEVALRAAFIATHSSKQVAVLTPTTLLAQQHFTNFQDRFAGWPIKIELISRFRSHKEQQQILAQLEAGKIDIIIGTHKLLQPSIKFKDLGLLIIDEEHRFGVKQKDHLKKLKSNIDILTLTATPIPRTLNMAFAGIRDFSIIATPPARRLAIKTFIHEYEAVLIKEAIYREILRGGQVYFLHNDIATIEKTAREISKLIPSARISIGHGQMREHQLELIMRDFYHLRSNVLVCTTIIESGIDIPTANTIIIDRADKFGLAQLHQLRGRVGRSHHQAYAYLIVPPEKLLTADAKKRLEAISSLEDLGAGFVLATNDLEIRGAGELLGENQSGQIQNIGFNLYMEMLEQAVNTLKSGKPLETELTLTAPPEIDLQIPALIPEKYVDDVNLRLVLYKRIASAKNDEELQDIQAEVIDRFGLLLEPTKNLFKVSTLKLQAAKMGITKIIIGNNKGNVIFSATLHINPQNLIKLVQKEPTIYKIKKSNQLEFMLSNNAPHEKIAFLERLFTKISGE